MAEEVLTKRGKENFAHNGFLYIFDKTSKVGSNLKLWRCEQNNRCKARLHTKAGEVVRELNSRSHEASAAQLQVTLVKTKIKKRAEETLESPTVAVNECLVHISQASLAVIPNMSALRKIIRRKHNSVMNAPTNPTDLQQLFVPECYRIYLPQPGVDENFLLCDGGRGPDWILIFRSRAGSLVTSDMWFADGTFSIAPNLFSQIYVILAKKHEGVHPIVYALLPNKQCTTYIDKYLDALATELPQELQDLLSWFEDTYVGRQNRRGNGR
ncbi:hypothetical protein chiPu_0024094 [Chiloscyllium punctatum]|uniref:FLYWCH-type domain-containing protein n=1 Tax=Chiloscyllium punctatum TaxID=137246 RepID=A0A401TBQ9_CHIPU|nr:hypothetical protein [Chiloscyllium punctatum]